MKKLFLFLPLLLIVSCGTSTTVLKGEIVGCEVISTVANSAEKIATECLDGASSVDVAAIKGPAIINVWGSWCAPCKEELPYFVDFNKNQSGKVQLVGVDVEEKSAEAGRAFAIEQGMNWPNLYDREGITREYFGMGVPVTWFIDATGRVVYKKIGPVKSADELRSLSEKYLGVS